MNTSPIQQRLATRKDIPALTELMHAAFVELQAPFLDEAQVASSRAIMGLDTELIADETCFGVEVDGNFDRVRRVSRRATIYRSDHSTGRDAALLDPTKAAARVRAMYTHPAFARRGWAA